jgi:hypothetical protein
MSAVEKIEESGATPIVSKNNASHETDLSQCILHKKRGPIEESRNCNISYFLVASNQVAVEAAIDRFRLLLDKFRVVRRTGTPWPRPTEKQEPNKRTAARTGIDFIFWKAMPVLIS